MRLILYKSRQILTVNLWKNPFLPILKIIKFNKVYCTLFSILDTCVIHGVRCGEICVEQRYILIFSLINSGSYPQCPEPLPSNQVSITLSTHQAT